LEPQILERAQHPISRRDIHPNVLKVLYRLIQAGHAAYLVGGGVRDLMLARRPKDFDVATSAHPQQVRDLFRNSRLIGRRFRLVHVFFGPHNIEVATFRRQAEAVLDDSDPMIRHDNTFGTAEEDAFRRDFTVNALFYDPRTFHVVDYISGVADLKARLIRTIGDPELRVREDPVRMIRAVRFAAKLGFEIEEATRAAIERHHAEILKASRPRMIEEIYRTLMQPAAARALTLMEELGLLAVLIPRLSIHLKAGGAASQDTLTGRNLAALEAVFARGGEPGHAFILAALFLDLYRSSRPSDGARHQRELLDDLRAQGFARGDTEHMRLLIDAFELLIGRSRRARRLLRRPYFAEARRLYDLVARNYGDDPAELDRFMASLAHSGPGEHARHEPRSADPGAASPPGPALARSGRRRHRRGGRRNRARHAAALHGTARTPVDERPDSH
jgi:poly(A) polymerase